MRVIRNILIGVLSVLAIAVVALFIYLNILGNNLESVKSELDTTRNDLQTAKQVNTDLTQKAKDMYIQYRNAQGRLSFFGDGTGKVAYLTFDDGPTNTNTVKILQTLQEKNAVATWFLLGNAKDYDYLNLDLCTKIEAAGSAVGIHDWDQDEKYLYYKGDVQNYFTTDFDLVKKALEDKVGHEIKICRFAGGSATIGYYNKANTTSIALEVLNRGYQFFDWNCSGGDSEVRNFVGNSAPSDVIVRNVLNDAKPFADSNSPICILLHDNPGKETTAAAVGQIIDGLREMGYEFKTLTYDSPGFYQTNLLG